jgi:hypothetical protein
VGALVSDADSGLADALRPVLAEVTREIRELETRVREVDRALEAWEESRYGVLDRTPVPRDGFPLAATTLMTRLTWRAIGNRCRRGVLG